ncbi:MAG: hypothetical protein L0Z62_22020 [Gemmataceae bacterium]|nr:hypothetical protein [Gemmataceae bacterium]
MTRVLGLLGAVMLAGILLGSGLGTAGPVAGSFGQRVEIVAGKPLVVRDPIRFRGGQRACVIVMGNLGGKSRPAMPLELEVRDAQDNLVGRDYPAQGAAQPDAPGNDVCVVIWYPPRDGEYKIKVTNHGSSNDLCWLALK